jgi:hypothetical protein
MTVIFTDTRAKNNPNILAHPELHFDNRATDGILYGLRITGLILMRDKNGKLMVMLPQTQRRFPIFKRIDPTIKTGISRGIIAAWEKQGADDLL